MQQKLKILNPYDQSEIKEIEYHTETEAVDALVKAKQAFDNGELHSKIDRIEILKKFKNLVIQNREELISQSLLEGGKPFKDTVAEIDRGINGIDLAIESLSRMVGEQIPMDINSSSENKIAFTTIEPRGVVIAVSAFNHPFNLIIHQVIPAVAAGCPVIIKPASTTPLSCISIVKLLHEAGLKPELCRVVIVSNDIAEKLVTDSRISFFSFIGSSRVGWHLKSKLAAGVDCALEHGGVAPLLIDETADLELACSAVTKGGFYHAGQVCVSVQRVYIQNAVKDKFIAMLKSSIESLKVGNPAEKDTDVGPLILPREVDRVEQWVEEAKKSGASVITGGSRLTDTIYPPTLIKDVSVDSSLMSKEVFGPVVCIEGYEDLDEAIEKANSLNVAFQAAVFTTNLNTSFKVAKKLKAQAVMVNEHTAFRVDWMPFGGYKESGLNVGGIEQTIKHMSIEKLCVFNIQERQNKESL